MKIVPLTLKEANQLVGSWHRHHKPVQGHRFSVGVRQGDRFVGAAIVGRPVNKDTAQYSIAEVTRLVTDGTKNACSILYASCARIAREMGFESIQTFILVDEPGTSLIAAGWEYVGVTEPSNWNSRPGRRTDQPTCLKKKFFKVLNK